MKRILALTLIAALSVGGAAPASAIDLGGTSTTTTTTDWTAKVDASVLSGATAGTTDFIAYMSARADLSAAASLATKEEKGRFVYETLTSTARTSQAGLLSQLAALGMPSQSFWISNSVVTSGDLALLQAVASRSDVKAVYAIGKGRLAEPVEKIPDGTTSADAVAAVGPSLAHVNADDVWAMGYRGQGAVVANADTGVRWTHNAIKSKYRGWDAATGTASHDYNWRDAIRGVNAVCPANSASPCDDHGHGTHTMGTMVGGSPADQIGMAPDANWMACRNMIEGFGVVPSYMDCMQWFIAPTRIDGSGADPSKAPDVVSNSWGCVEVCAPPMLKDMIDASRAAGILYVVSAGNDGQWVGPFCDNIVWPLAVYKSAFTVGATGATSDGIAGFSSRGPVPDNFIEGVLYRKPDIVAPGVGIRSSVSGNDNAYASFSGTSMSSPHVAGLVALMISANPALRGHVDAIEDIITKTAVPLTTTAGCGGDSSTQVPNNVYGWGRIDALRAVQLALETEPTPNASQDLVGLPAQVIDVTKETALQTHPTEDFASGRTGTTTWRVVKDTGNCCENHLGVSSGGRLFDIGGNFINYTDDRGVSWKSVRPLDPLVNAEGSMAMAPNGDVLGMTWDAYSGDHFVAYKFNAASGEWKTLTNKIHQVVYDRPWLTLIPGPFEDLTGKTVPYISIVQGGTGVKDPMWVSTDGLVYVEPSSLRLGTLTNTQVNAPFPIAAEASFDWIQPIRSAPVTGFGAGYAGANGGFLLDPATREWSSWRMPDGSAPPTYIQVDSGGRIHNVRSAGAGRLEYRISSDGGLSWTSTFVDLPFGGLTDFKVNRALGVSALVLRINNQDWAYKFDISGDAAQIVRRYRVGLGDNPAGVGIGQLTNPRMDFQTIAILPDGRVAVSFLDSTTFSHPPGTGMLGRITPALAIELDTTFEEPVVFEHLTTGGGWTPTVDGGKLNFGFRAAQNADGRSGDLGLNDKGGGAKVEITAWSSIGAVSGPCGGIADGPSALQLTGSGTFNGAPATFRACAEDNGHGGKNGSPDRFYLECTGGCTYSTSERVSQDHLGGGNIDVQRDPREGGTTEAAAESSGEPSTLILDPVLLDELAPGALQTFSVRVYDAQQRPLAGASVTVAAVAASGTSAVTALSDASGLAVLVLTALGEDAEYVATSGDAMSNAVQVTAILAP